MSSRSVFRRRQRVVLATLRGVTEHARARRLWLALAVVVIAATAALGTRISAVLNLVKSKL